MNFLQMLATGGAKPVTETFTANATWIAPSGVTRIDTLVGKGAPGAPAGSPVDRSSTVNFVRAVSTFGGTITGSLSWGDFQGEATAGAAQINAGGSGSFHGTTYVGYPNSNTYDISLTTISYFDAVPGSASVSYSSGWKTSGTVLAGDLGISTVTWQEYGSATTGASASAFGKTFPGGNGGPAIPASYSSVPVTPGQSYPITVPGGGSVTITYLK